MNDLTGLATLTRQRVSVRTAGFTRLLRNGYRLQLLISRCIYEVTGPRYALRRFATHVETRSAPRILIIPQIAIADWMVFPRAGWAASLILVQGRLGSAWCRVQLNQQRMQFGDAVDQVIRAPFVRRQGVAAVAVGGGDGAHAGGLACLDVAQVVADVDDGFGGDAHGTGGVQQRGRVGFGVRGGVAADDAGAGFGQAEQGYQRFGEPGDFVGDDAPADLAPVKFRQQRGDAVEQGGGGADVGGIVGQEFIAHGRVGRVVGGQAEGLAEQAAGAGRG